MLLAKLKTQRRIVGRAMRTRYLADRQISQVWEHDRWVDSWASETIPQTKKADVETGEDAKGE